MDLSNLSGLPDWDDERLGRRKSDGFFESETLKIAKQLYEQWKEVMLLLNAVFDGMNVHTGEDGFSPEHWSYLKQIVRGNAYEVAVKIKSTEGASFAICVENAFVIRSNAQHISSSMLQWAHETAIEHAHATVVRTEIEKFRRLFRKWVSSFQKDEFTDDWGLF